MKKHAVLILDDDDSIAEILTEIITDKYPGTMVQSTPDLTDAILKMYRQKFDLVILEPHLKDSNGLDLISAIDKSPTKPDRLLVFSEHFKSEQLVDLPHKADFMAKPTGADVVEEYLFTVFERPGAPGQSALGHEWFRVLFDELRVSLRAQFGVVAMPFIPNEEEPVPVWSHAFQVLLHGRKDVKKVRYIFSEGLFDAILGWGQKQVSQSEMLNAEGLWIKVLRRAGETCQLKWEVAGVHVRFAEPGLLFKSADHARARSWQAEWPYALGELKIGTFRLRIDFD